MSQGYDFLGEKIRKIRVMKNYSQEELGKALNLPKQSISRIEKDKRRVSVKELDIMSDFFNVPLMFFTEDGWIDKQYKSYENALEDSNWGAVPYFCQNFLTGLEEYFDYQYNADDLRIKDVYQIVRGTTKGLNKILVEYEKKLK
jgi:transcriptional regulator with XRE-family HTH domain